MDRGFYCLRNFLLGKEMLHNTSNKLLSLIFFINFRPCNILDSCLLICKPTTICCDMLKNSQCEVLHCTFQEWTWPSFHRKQFSLSQLACWIVSLSIKENLFRYFYKLSWSNRNWAAKRANPTLSRRIFSVVNIDNFSPETQQMKQPWVACIWLLVT